MSLAAVPELDVLKDVLQIISDVQGDTDTLSAVTAELNRRVLRNCQIFVFALDQLATMFVQVYPQVEDKIIFELPNLAHGHASDPLIAGTIRGLLESHGEDFTRRQIVVRPIYSLGILRAVVAISHAASDLDGDLRINFVSTVARSFLWVLERDQLLTMFREVQVPIDFHQTTAEYFRGIGALIQRSSRMPFIAIREYDKLNNALPCLAHAGFPGLTTPALDIPMISKEECRAFYDCVRHGKPVSGSEQDAPELLGRLRLFNIKSFIVVPIFVGGEMFGVLSFGCSIDNYIFSVLETAGFEAIGNAVGLSITNFRNFNRRVETERESAERDMALLAVEIAQHARHEARDRIEEAEVILERLIEVTKRTYDIDRLSKTLRDKLRDVDTAVDRIKEATTIPSAENTLCLLADICKTAFSGVQYKLDWEHVDRTVVGNVKDTARVFASFDTLRRIFLHLILNSYDAFRRQRVKSKSREIRIEINDYGPKTKFFIIRYSDNAGGIDPSKLRIKTAGEDPNAPSKIAHTVLDIFKRGVTSKGGAGSGYGLFLVRKNINDIGGSIDLREHRGGVVFEIKFPKPSARDVQSTERRAGSQGR